MNTLFTPDGNGEIKLTENQVDTLLRFDAIERDDDMLSRLGIGLEDGEVVYHVTAEFEEKFFDCTAPFDFLNDSHADLPQSLWATIREALQGDSNDAEHDALAAVADYFGIAWTPFDDLND